MVTPGISRTLKSLGHANIYSAIRRPTTIVPHKCSVLHSLHTCFPWNNDKSCLDSLTQHYHHSSSIVQERWRISLLPAQKRTGTILSRSSVIFFHYGVCLILYRNAYREMKSCMLIILGNCIEGRYDQTTFTSKSDEIKKNFLTLFGNFYQYHQNDSFLTLICHRVLGDQNFWCQRGGLGVSSDFLPKGYNCDPVFYHVSEGCTATYRKIFRANTSSIRLCKYVNRKECAWKYFIKRLLDILQGIRKGQNLLSWDIVSSLRVW